MTTYLYPHNLKAKANLWLWSLKDFCILVMAALISVFIWINTGIYLFAVMTMCYGFMTIRLEDITVMDFITYAVRYFLTTPQYFEWG